MTPPGYVSSTDQAKLVDYLNNGGNLYFESVNVGFDYDGTTFFDYLGISFEENGEEDEIHNLKGNVPGDDVLFKFDYVGGDSPHYSCDKLDKITATKLYSSEEGAGRIYIQETEDYKAITSSAIIAAFSNGDTLNLKEYMMSEYINYFLGFSPTVDVKENLFANHSQSSYPNPFTTDVTVEFTLEKNAEVFIGIYDLNGQLVKTLENNNLVKGNHKYQWNASNENEMKVPAGMYFCRINTGKEVLTEKLLLMR